MSGNHDWKPGHGVRSVGDVFNLIVKENGLLAGVLSGSPNTEAKPAPISNRHVSAAVFGHYSGTAERIGEADGRLECSGLWWKLWAPPWALGAQRQRSRARSISLRGVDALLGMGV